jgi:hypothetical protein
MWCYYKKMGLYYAYDSKKIKIIAISNFISILTRFKLLIKKDGDYYTISK